MRKRRTPEQARREILEAAEQLLIEGGPGAIEMRAVARRIGVTDAAVHYHFGSRESLLGALLRHGGRRLKRELVDAIAKWPSDDPDLEALIAALARLYADGYARLGLALHMAGWRDERSGLLDPIVDCLHRARAARAAKAGERPPAKSSTRIAVAELHQAMALDSLFGPAFRRSAGLGERASESSRAHRRWWASALRRELGL